MLWYDVLKKAVLNLSLALTLTVGAPGVTAGGGSGGGSPAAPTNLLITAQTANSQSLSWTAAAGATGGYNIYRNGSFLANTAGTTYTDNTATGTCSPTTFVPATIYAYSVRSTNGSSESAAAFPAVYLYRNGVATQGQAEFSNGEVTTWNSTDVAVPQGTFSAKCIYAGGGGQFQPISQTPLTPAYALEIGAFNYCVFDVYLTDTTHKVTLGLISRPGGTSGEDVFNTKGADPWIASGGSSPYGTVGLNQWGTLKVPLSELSMGISTFMGWISGTTLNISGAILTGFGPDAGGFITGAGVTAGTFISQNNPPLAGPMTLNNSMSVGSSGAPVLLTCQRTNMYKMAANVTSGTTIYYNNIGFTTT